MQELSLSRSLTSASQQEVFSKWQSMSEEERQAARARINAEFAPSQEAKLKERVNCSGIPNKYRKAQITPTLQRLLEQLERHEIEGVLLQGQTGRGKTYAACSMLLEHLRSNLGKFSTFNEILNRVRGAYSSAENPDEVFGRYKGTKLLVIDDLGKENISPDSITKLFELLDYRIANELPTVITTQFSTNELMQRYTAKINDAEMVSAVLSRLSGFVPIQYNGNDRRLH